MGKLTTTNLPVGFIFPVINSNVVPPGCLECNGALISQSTYAALHTGHPLSLNGLYGTSGGSFYLPDFRGRVPRGWDHGAGRDPNAGSRIADSGGITGDNVGSMQNDQFDSHSHTVTSGGNVLQRVGEIIGGGVPRQMAEFGPPLGTPATFQSQGGGETRGKNFNVMWCIKY
jgi:hypothetical protein